MAVEPGTPYGAALRDYHQGRLDAALTVHSDLGEHDEMPVSLFFRDADNLFPFERAALDRCRGTVLDLGAGTGVHALELQKRGVPVSAVEIVPEAVEIMRARGVRQVTLGDGFGGRPAPVDTLLMMMNGVGPLGTLAGLDAFLDRAPRMLKRNGQILVDSGEAQRCEDATGPPGMTWPPRTGDYPGEAWVRLEYRSAIGPPFRELYVDCDTLAKHAAEAGWRAEVVFRGEGGGYLTRLTRR